MSIGGKTEDKKAGVCATDGHNEDLADSLFLNNLDVYDLNSFGEGYANDMKPWLDIDIAAYINSNGNNINSGEQDYTDDSVADTYSASSSNASASYNERHNTRGNKSSSSNSSSIGSSDTSSGTRRRASSKRRSDATSDSDDKTSEEGGAFYSKRKRLTSLAASERVYEFPAKLITAMNTGSVTLLAGVINEYCVPNCGLKTKYTPNSLTGTDKIVGFLSMVYESCPDMIIEITDLRLKRDRSIVFKGKFEGTYVQAQTENVKEGEDIEDMMYEKNASLVEQIIEGRSGVKHSAKLSSAELRELEKLEEMTKKDPDGTQILSKVVYTCRIVFLSSKIGAAAGAPVHQLITHLDWDWKTVSMTGQNLEI
jgi:hypothetical protein